MSGALRNPPVTAADRLGLTLFFAVVIHAIIFLGISFKPDLIHPPQDKHPPMEIILVHQRSKAAPDKAEFLAQANLEGGGNTEKKMRPSSPASLPLPREQAGRAQAVTRAASPARQRPPQDELMLTQQPAKRRHQIQKETPPHRPEPLTAAALVARSMEIASLSAEIDRSRKIYAQRLKHRYISSQAREYRDAAYLDAWRAKIERIGNLNYPEEAKRKKIAGSLILDVALNADGTIYKLSISHSSGKKILDDAALRIVRLAAPFAPFPEALRKDTDVLHITRTWQFLNDNTLQTNR